MTEGEEKEAVAWVAAAKSENERADRLDQTRRVLFDECENLDEALAGARKIELAASRAGQVIAAASPSLPKDKQPAKRPWDEAQNAFGGDASDDDLAGLVEPELLTMLRSLRPAQTPKRPIPKIFDPRRMLGGGDLDGLGADVRAMHAEASGTPMYDEKKGDGLKDLGKLLDRLGVAAPRKRRHYTRDTED